MSHYLADSLQVRDLPARINSGDGRCFSTFPLHRPEPACGAHSVIASCLADDAFRAYAKLPRAARNDLRNEIGRTNAARFNLGLA